MIIQTTRFGEIEIDEKEIITMSSGLLGFSSDRLFVVLDDESGSPFKWLQAVENPGLAFITIEPQLAISNFSLPITAENMKKLDTKSVDNLITRVIVTMTRDIKDVTINLQGPLVFNVEKRLGLQMVISDSQYSTRHPLFGDKIQYEAVEEATESEDVRKVAVG